MVLISEFNEDTSQFKKELKLYRIERLEKLLSRWLSSISKNLVFDVQMSDIISSKLRVLRLFYMEDKSKHLVSTIYKDNTQGTFIVSGYTRRDCLISALTKLFDCHELLFEAGNH